MSTARAALSAIAHLRTLLATRDLGVAVRDVLSSLEEAIRLAGNPTVEPALASEMGLWQRLAKIEIALLRIVDELQDIKKAAAARDDDVKRDREEPIAERN